MNNETNEQNQVVGDNTQTTTVNSEVQEPSSQQIDSSTPTTIETNNEEQPQIEIVDNTVSEQPVQEEVQVEPEVTQTTQEEVQAEPEVVQTPQEEVQAEPEVTQTPQEEVQAELEVVQTPQEEVQSTQVQGSQTVEVPSQIAENVEVNNIGIQSGNTEILDLKEISSNVHDANNINIVESATLQGASGSSVIGSVNGDNASANNNPLPKNIDLSKPVVEEKKDKTKKVKVVTKKEKIISIIVTIFVILVLGAAGYSAYYFGYLKNPGMFSVKTINIELGDKLPTSVSYYVDSPLPLDDMEYNVDTSQVAYDIVGTYYYNVSHKNVVKTGQIIIKDTIAPDLLFKDQSQLVFMINQKILKQDLVESCTDISNCEYKLDGEVDTSTPGEKEINVIAEDDRNNKKTYTIIVKVYDIQRTISCESTPVLSENQSYTTSNLVELSFDRNDELVLTKKYKQNTFLNIFDYYEDEENYKNDEKYIFDRVTYSYKVEDDSREIINVTSFNDVLKYYSDNSYTCK